MEPEPVRSAAERALDDPLIEMDEKELAAFRAAIEEARADPLGVPHEEVAAWLQQIATGNFDAPMPVPRLLS